MRMQNDRLPSWNDTAAKRAVLGFVDRVTQAGSPDLVAEENRIAVFDNDGTLWCEKPLPIQADFLLRELGAQAEKDPSLRSRQPWKAVSEKDYAWLSNVITKHYQGDDKDLKIMASGLLKAFDGATIEEFAELAENFLRSTEHPTLKRPYLECAYQPMIELLRCLDDAGFRTYIASGGGRDFMRPVTEVLYGVPSDRVIGSAVALDFKDDGKIAEIIHKPALDVFDDGPAKPIRIWSRIGKRPIFAVGNSNGDVPMLRFCEHPSRPSMSLLIDHDDESREFTYKAGAEESLRQAKASGWTIVSMKQDWRSIFSPRPQARKAA